jgi:multiple sugar transport system ATP-binding protein
MRPGVHVLAPVKWAVHPSSLQFLTPFQYLGYSFNSHVNIIYEEVSKHYGSFQAVDRLNLKIDSGEFLVLLGPSGCGKTTTLRMLAGLEDVSSGSIFIGETCVNQVAPRDRDVAMVFQSYALYPHMTVRENIAYPLRVRKVPRAEIPARVKKVTELLGIADLLQRKPKELSGGQRQRVALARAIVRQPSVYLMDEPLSNLDAKLRLHMRGELKRLQYELGTTTLYVTHDQAEAMTLAHRVAVMQAGRVRQLDTPLNIYARPANRFVAGFLGSPGMNFLEGQIDLAEGRFGNHEVSLPLDAGTLTQLKRCQRVTLGVRPEAIRVSAQSFEGSIPASIYVTEALGNETFLLLNLGKEKLIARSDPTLQFDIGTTVWFSFDKQALHFFDPVTGDRLG